jgi:hypothetical protein
LNKFVKILLILKNNNRFDLKDNINIYYNQNNNIYSKNHGIFNINNINYNENHNIYKRNNNIFNINTFNYNKINNIYNTKNDIYHFNNKIKLVWLKFL